MNNNEEQVNHEIIMMESSIGNQVEVRSLWSVLSDPKLTLPLILVCALQGGQQLSGINAVFYYSVSIFKSAGFTATGAEWANLGAGCINLFIACFSPFLMKNIDRRPLAFLSCLVSGIFLATLVFIVHYIDDVGWFPYACVLAVFGYIIFYQIGLGPIPYFIGSGKITIKCRRIIIIKYFIFSFISELFEVGPRPAAMAIGSVASWSCNFIVGMCFPTFQALWNAFVFVPFSIVCIVLALFLRVYLPETRGRDPSIVAPLVSKGFKSKPNSSLM